MNKRETQQKRLSESDVIEDFQRQPLIFMQLAQNALTVAESFRANYLKNTADFISKLRKAMQQNPDEREEPILTVYQVDDTSWSDVSGEVVTFIDGGVGRVQISSQVPILLRVGSYCVRTGERRLSEREQFGYYPVILGDLEGGSKERKDFIDIVRITAELLGGLAALERTPDLRVLMFHGPLVYLMSGYAGHTHFTEKDIDRFLQNYAPNSEQAHQLKEDFLLEAKLDIYPKLTPESSDLWIKKRVFEPLSWISFLYRRLIKVAKERKPTPVIAGAVERGELREFSEKRILERVFRGLRKKNKETYFNDLYGRTDLTSPKLLLDKLGYTDSILLALLLQPGERCEEWGISKYDGLGSGKIALPGEAASTHVDFSQLKPSEIGFPKVIGCYVHVGDNTEPIRVEVFADLGGEQITEAARRVYLYSRMLPGYGFPVGLDIADKFAKVPAWMTTAYSKLIKHHLGVSLQQGDITDEEMRRLLVQAIYMTHRDWLFRPQS